MAITLIRAIEMMARPAGYFYSGQLTSIGGAAGASITDSAITREDTNVLKGKWVYLTSGAKADESRQISSVAAGVITPTVAFSAQIADDVTFYVMEHDPNIYIDALQQAARTLSDRLWLPVTEYLAVDNLLSNSHFETFSTTFTGWTNIGTPTLAQSTRTVHGTYSASITASGAVEGIEQNILAKLNQINAIGKTLHVRGWTWDDAESSSRIRVTFDGSTYTNGAYNTGDGEWKGFAYNAIGVAIPADLTEATISCEVADGETGLFKWVVAWVDEVYQYALPSTIPYPGPHTLEMQVYEDKPEGLYRPYGGQHTSGRILRMQSMGPLTVPTTSASIELSEPRGELLIAQAAVYAHQTMMGTDAGHRDEHLRQMGLWQDRVNRLSSNTSMKMGGMGASDRTYWHVLESGETRTLELLR